MVGWWVYKTKLNVGSFVNKHKAKLIIQGYSQVSGLHKNFGSNGTLGHDKGVACFGCPKCMKNIWTGCEIGFSKWLS